MTAEFARVGMPFERFPAVDGTALSESVKPFFCNAAGKIVSPLRAGEIGCYASHLLVWQRIAAGHYGSAALVCEDDLHLPNDLPALPSEAIRGAPRGWDIIRLSSSTERWVVSVSSLSASRMLARYSRAPILAGAYLLSPSGAAKLLKPRTCSDAVDIDFAQPWLFDLVDYGVLPAPVAQNIGPSTIAARGGIVRRKRGPVGRLFDPNRFLRLAFNVRRMGAVTWARAALRHKVQWVAGFSALGQLKYVRQSSGS